MCSTSKMLHADFVIAGGGTAGCVLAARLSERGYQTLLITSGSDDSENPIITEKSRVETLLSDPMFKHLLFTKPLKSLDDRILYVTVRKTLGGSSVNNGWMERIGPNDWDEFVRATGDESFSYENMKIFYDMVEDYSSLNPSVLSSNHGTNGPIKLTREFDPSFEDAWRNVAAETNETFTADLTGEINYGLSFEPVAFRNGRRSWCGNEYLIPAMKNYPNLILITKATVLKLELNESTQRIDHLSFISPDGYFHAVAAKEFILSCGSLYSPQILMLSGIGSEESLRKANITVKHNLEHVGRHLLDNGLLFMHYSAQNISNGSSIPIGLVNTELPTDATNAKIFFLFKMNHETKAMTVVIFNASPKSSAGSVTLLNNDPLTPPIIEYEYLSNEDDLKTFTNSIHYVRKIIASESLKQFGPFTEIAPGAETNDFHKYVKETLMPGHHFVGTCCMGTTAENSVVDRNFRVHGIENLRVVDGSVFPSGLTSKMGPCLTIYALAEKAAQVISNSYSKNA